MTEDSGLDKRRKALEELFFAKKDQELLEKLRQESEQKKAVELLGEQLGIEDSEILKHLVAAGIEADTFAALSLVPLVAVGWADGKMADAERSAILSAAKEQGVQAGSPSYRLLQQWLDEAPDGQLEQAWCDYVTALKDNLDAAHHRHLGELLLGRARRVAESAGGFLGIGKISSEEKDVLSKLKQAFE